MDITDANSLGDFSIWNGERSAPLSQVTERVETTWEFPQVRTYKTVVVNGCNVRRETGAYDGGSTRRNPERNREYPTSPKDILSFGMPSIRIRGRRCRLLPNISRWHFLHWLLFLVCLFGNFRDPVIILCVLPLSLIGIAVGAFFDWFRFWVLPDSRLVGVAWDDN